MGDATMRGEVEAELDKLVGMDKVKDFFTNLRETVEYVERREEPTSACYVLVCAVCARVCVCMQCMQRMQYMQCACVLCARCILIQVWLSLYLLLLLLPQVPRPTRHPPRRAQSRV